MQENMLNDMTKEILKDIGIVAVGDMLLILRHAKKVGLFIFFARKQNFCQSLKRNFDCQFVAIFPF